MRRLASSLVFGSLLSLAVLLPGSASAASAGSTLFGSLNTLLGQFTSSITLGSNQSLSSLFPRSGSTLTIFTPRQRAQVSAVPEPGAFLAFGVGALVIGASLRRRSR
jgi:hypothetical protein